MRVAPRRRSALIMVIFMLLLGGLAGCDGASNVASHPALPTPTATETPDAPTATAASAPTHAGGAAWSTFSDTTYQFSIDMPGYLTARSYDAFGGDGHAQVWVDSTAGPNDAVSLRIAAASQIKAADCELQGSPITVGQGIAAVQFGTYNAPPPPPGASLGPPRVDASFIAGGVYTTIELVGSIPSDTFMQRYGAAWSHMLASFAPGPAMPDAHPCS